MPTRDHEPISHWIAYLKAGDLDAAQPLRECYDQRLVRLARARLRPGGYVDDEDIAPSAFRSFCMGAARGRFPRLADRHDLWKLLVFLTAQMVWLVDYPHAPNAQRRDDGKSITGGYVYRGRALPELTGVYVYADYDTGRIWGLRERDGQAVSNGELIDLRRNPRLNIAAFGEDAQGEIYILAFDGRIHRLVRRP